MNMPSGQSGNAKLMPARDQRKSAFFKEFRCVGEALKMSSCDRDEHKVTLVNILRILRSRQSDLL
jgi:hypothetical protein